MKKVFTVMLMVLLGSTIIFTACSNDIAEPDSNKIDDEENSDENIVEEKPSDQEVVDETNEPPIQDENYETHQVILYFSDNDLMSTYRIYKEIIVRKGEELYEATLQAWLDGPDHEDLSGLFHSDVFIEYVEIVDGVAYVSFSKEIYESNLGSSGELMFAEQLALIMEQFGYERTQIMVEGSTGEALLGHLYTGEPIVANDPESYLWIDEKSSREIVLQNAAFQIFEPAPGSEVKDRVIVRGLARTFEGTIIYEFEDGHFILDEGFTTASKGAPNWGEFEIIIDFDDVANYSGRVILFEESAKDGSRLNELHIPITVIK